MQETDLTQKLADILRQSERIVFFGGAGVSCASGIPDFRSANGIFSQKLHKNISPEEAVSHSFYVNHTEEFFAFYKKFLVYPDAKPNACHNALVALQNAHKLHSIVTQNIDGLHQEAGSTVVRELHGSVKRNFCTKCGAFYDVDFILQADGVPKCTKCGALVKPDVVLYEENLDTATVSNAINDIQLADTLIIGGTSLVVYPAASLIQYFAGKNLVLINKSTTPSDHLANLVIHDAIECVLAHAVQSALT